MGFTGSAFSVCPNLVSRCFIQNGPQDREKSTFSAFVAHFGPENGEVFSVHTAPVGCTKGPKRRKVFDQNNFFETATRNKISRLFFDFFRVRKLCVGWVPNLQNRAPSDETVPNPPPNGHVSGPRVPWDPKRGSLRPHQIWSVGDFAQNSPQNRENQPLGVFGPFWAPGGRKISLSPPDPSKNQ